MIALIDQNWDISYFLEKNEINKLKDQALEGMLVSVDKPNKQGTTNISVIYGRCNVRTFNGIGVSSVGSSPNSLGEIKTLLNDFWFKELQRTGKVGLRQWVFDGAMIEVYDRSRLKGVKPNLAALKEFYHNNKNQHSLQYYENSY